MRGVRAHASVASAFLDHTVDAAVALFGLAVNDAAKAISRRPDATWNGAQCHVCHLPQPPIESGIGAIRHCSQISQSPSRPSHCQPQMMHLMSFFMILLLPRPPLGGRHCC
jgi:hypothetical protein